MVAIVEPSRPTRRAHARQCVGSGSCARDKTPDPGTDRNQQYSITAPTDGGGAIVERYGYSVYSDPVFPDGSDSPIAASFENNRYTYTGREWDEELHLYHYRARMYDPLAGRFLGRDPIGFEGSPWGLYEYVEGSPSTYVDPDGKNPIRILKILPEIGKWVWNGCNWVWTKVRGTPRGNPTAPQPPKPPTVQQPPGTPGALGWPGAPDVNYVVWVKTWLQKTSHQIQVFLIKVFP